MLRRVVLPLPLGADDRYHSASIDFEIQASQGLDLDVTQPVRFHKRIYCDSYRLSGHANLTVLLTLDKFFLAEKIAGKNTPSKRSPMIELRIICSAMWNAILLSERSE